MHYFTGKIMKYFGENTRNLDTIRLCYFTCTLFIRTRNIKCFRCTIHTYLRATIKFYCLLNCSCSVCLMKQNHHFIVPKAKFTLIRGGEDGKLKTYTFNTKKAQHKFCAKCGVQSFYVPRSNQDGYGK